MAYNNLNNLKLSQLSSESDKILRKHILRKKEEIEIYLEFYFLSFILIYIQRFIVGCN